MSITMRLGIAAALLLAWSGGARAAGTCSFVAAPSISFGGYSSLSGAVNAQTNIQITCLPTLPALSVAYTLKLGTGSSLSYFPRLLKAGGYSLQYNLYRDSNRTQIWGDGTTSGTFSVSSTCTAACVVPVYGRITASQSVPAASYSDSVVVTVEF